MKSNKIFIILLSSLLTTSCITNTSTNNSSLSNSNVDSTINNIPNSENEVKIKKISAYDNQVDNAQILNRKESNRSQDELNYIIIYKSQTDIQFTITLDNPEAYGIDALRVKCDDENAQIQVDGEWKPIAFESDGTRVVNWSSEDPYEKTYNIRTTSDDAMNIFEVIDIRLSGHEKFQSKETKNTDIGNNELQIHKMDEDAYRVEVIENTFEYVKFKLTVKESYKDIIYNINVDGETADSEGIYTLYENKNIKVKYDYKINDELMVNRSNNEKIERLYLRVSTDNCQDNLIFSYTGMGSSYRSLNANHSEASYIEFYALPIFGTGYTHGLMPNQILIYDNVINVSTDNLEICSINNTYIFPTYIDNLEAPLIYSYNSSTDENYDEISIEDPIYKFSKNITYVISGKKYKPECIFLRNTISREFNLENMILIETYVYVPIIINLELEEV